MPAHGDFAPKQRATKLKRNSCALGRYTLVTHGLGRPHERSTSRRSPTEQIGIFTAGAELRIEGAVEFLQNFSLEKDVACSGYAPVNYRAGLEARTLKYLPLHRPGRRTFLEFWEDRTQHSIRAVLEKGLVECAQPGIRWLFVIIDERHQLAGRHRDRCVTSDRNILPWLDPVTNGNTCSLGPRLDSTPGGLGFVISHDDHRKSEQALSSLLTELVKKLLQLCRAPVCADTDRD